MLLVPILRFLHIIAGIIWAGGAILMNLVIGPAIGATGDAGRQFAGHLMGKTTFPKIMMSSGLVTVLAGTVLYGINSTGLVRAGCLQIKGLDLALARLPVL